VKAIVASVSPGLSHDPVEPAASTDQGRLRQARPFTGRPLSSKRTVDVGERAYERALPKVSTAMQNVASGQETPAIPEGAIARGADHEPAFQVAA
jgi:hypothetical protein